MGGRSKKGSGRRQAMKEKVILETSMIILMLFIFDWRIGLIAAAGVLIFFGGQFCDAECG